MTEPSPNDGALPFTLRETSRRAGDPRVWGLLGLAGIALGAAGPFGSYARDPLAERMPYWTIVVVATFWAGSALSETLRMVLIRHRIPRLRGLLLTHLALPLPIAGLVLLLALGFGAAPTVAGATMLVAQCMAISLAVDLAARLIRPSRPAPATPAVPAPGSPPALLDRLPPARRGSLLWLSSQGHYVEVATTRGRGLLLMRLADAIGETAPEPGLQVHRSHWVALRAVTGARRQDGRAQLLLRDGTAVPVSRARMAAARAAGLL